MKDSLFALLYHYPILFVGGAGLIALEAWAWYVMQRSYFTQGLPIFASEIELRPPAGDIVRWLSEVQPKGFWGEFRFKTLDPKLIALRECFNWKKLWGPHYLPMMRTTLEFDPTRGRMRMTAYLNYWLPLLLLPGLLISLHKATTPMRAATAFFGYALVVVGFYVVQIIRYKQLLKALETQGQTLKQPERKFSGL